MTDSMHNALRTAVTSLFRPLARTLIRNGIPWGTYTDWAKKVYVDVAYEEFPEPGKKPTVSRVSALTGLFRREVKRLLDLPDASDGDAPERYNRAVRVISGWNNDPLFQDASGQPADLPMDNADASFAELVRRHSGDITPRAMLTVLRDAETIEEQDNGQLRLVKHAFVPGKDSVDRLNILGTDTAELISTIDHNITAEPEERFYQRKVSNAQLPVEQADAFKHYAATRAQQLLEELDGWLAEREATAPDATVQYVSVGIYYSEHHESKEPGHEDT